MQRTRFWRLVGNFVFAFAILAASSAHAQPGNGNGHGGNNPPPPPPSPFNYRIEYVDFHVNNNGANSKPDDVALVDDGNSIGLVVVGRSVLINGQSRAFVYQRQTQTLIDVPTFLGLDENVWISTTCKGISDDGIVIGNAKDSTGAWHGYWLDLLAVSPTLNLLEVDFPELINGADPIALDVNANGDVLVGNGWVVNIVTGDSFQLSSTIQSPIALNDSGTVIGMLTNGNAIRHNIYSAATESFAAATNPSDINNFGEFCGYARIYFRKNQYKIHAYRWGFGTQFDWLSDPSLARFADSLNDAGDVAGQTPYPYGGFLHYAADGQTYLLKDLVDDAYFDAASLGFMLITERDTSLSTPAPIIVGNAESSIDEKMFILIPEEPDP